MIDPIPMQLCTYQDSCAKFYCDWKVSEWLSLTVCGGTMGIGVHMVKTSHVIITYTLQSSSSLTKITHNLQTTINFDISNHVASKVVGEITFAFPNSNSSTVEGGKGKVIPSHIGKIFENMKNEVIGINFEIWS